MPLSTEDSAKVVALHDGYSFREVADMKGFTKYIIERAVAWFHESESYDRRLALGSTGTATSAFEIGVPMQ